jgi:hypothetical protein
MRCTRYQKRKKSTAGIKFKELFSKFDELAKTHPLNPQGMEKLTIRDLVDGDRKQ